MPNETSRIHISKRAEAITAASILFFLSGIPTPIAYTYFALYTLENRTGPVFLGLRPFEAPRPFALLLGIDSLIVLAFVFAFFSAIDVLVGYWLWRSLKKGGKLAFVLFPFGMFFWIGFGIPGLWILGPLRLILIASAWKTLR